MIVWAYLETPVDPNWKKNQKIHTENIQRRNVRCYYRI